MLLGTNHISRIIEARVIKFCTQIGYFKSQHMEKFPFKGAWIGSRDPLLGRLYRVDLIKWVSNVCPPVRTSVRPQKVFSNSVLVGYLTVWTNISCYQTSCRRPYNLPYSNVPQACNSTYCVHISSTAAVQNSQLSFSWAIRKGKERKGSVFI